MSSNLAVSLEIFALMLMQFLCLLLQHIPRINGEIPSIDEATLDHQRLLDRYFISSFVKDVKIQSKYKHTFHSYFDLNLSATFDKILINKLYFGKT